MWRLNIGPPEDHAGLEVEPKPRAIKLEIRDVRGITELIICEELLAYECLADSPCEHGCNTVKVCLDTQCCRLTLALTGAPQAGAAFATDAKAVTARRVRVQRGVRTHYESHHASISFDADAKESKYIHNRLASYASRNCPGSINRVILYSAW